VTVVTDGALRSIIISPHHEPLGPVPMEKKMSYLMYPFAVAIMMFGGVLAAA
jgi:hypothetical protein